MKLKNLRLVLPLMFCSAAAQANLVISEVLYDAPNNDSTEEFVELYNNGCDAVDLTSYSLQDNSTSIHLSGVLNSGEYATIAKNQQGFTALFGTPATFTGMTLGLGNSGDQLSLRNGTTIVDIMGWEGGLTGWTIGATNKSLERTAALDSDSQSDWSVASGIATPGAGILIVDTNCTPIPTPDPTPEPTPDDSSLANGVAKTALSASTGTQINYTITTPADVTALNIAMSGGSGDGDLYVKFGSVPTTASYDCRPYLNGNGESCNFTSAQVGTYYVMVNAYSSFANVSLLATYQQSPAPTPDPTPVPGDDSVLNNGDTRTNVTATTGQIAAYTMDVPADATSVNITISGGTGDADLYVKLGAKPTSSSYDCRPYKNGNAEQCTFATSTGGKYYIDLSAYSSFSGLTLTASYQATSPTPDPIPTPDPTPDPSGFDFNTYYSAAIGQTGATLKEALNQRIRGHVRLTYDEVWTALMTTDEDPQNPNNIILLYSGRSQDKETRANQTTSLDGWNREHVWAKSHGFPSSSQYAYTDINHLRPADVSINSSRGNKDFDNGGTALTESPANKTDADSFEPADAVKGDVARMVFYMDVRYEGNDSSGTPDLSIVNYAGTATGEPLLGTLCVLLQWHIQDPVSDWERLRNSKVYIIQQNRNPFIDNPQWALDLYSAQCQ